MVQPEDNRTIPLPLPDVTEKRGRGRPRKEGALTNAERQAAFRARRKGTGVSVTVTRNSPADGYNELVLENRRLRDELAQARRELESAGGVSAGRDALPVVLALREPIPAESRQADCRLGVTVAFAARCAMERLAADVGISKGEAVERLLYWADMAMMRTFLSDEQFNRYLERKRNGK